MEPLEPEASVIRLSPAVDRVTISRPEAEKVQRWIDQFQAASRGFMEVTKSDLINFLIRAHKSELTAKETAQLRSHHYDPVRHMQWITQELKMALAKNDVAMVSVLQEEIRACAIVQNCLGGYAKWEFGIA